MCKVGCTRQGIRCYNFSKKTTIYAFDTKVISFIIKLNNEISHTAFHTNTVCNYSTQNKLLLTFEKIKYLFNTPFFLIRREGSVAKKISGHLSILQSFCHSRHKVITNRLLSKQHIWEDGNFLINLDSSEVLYKIQINTKNCPR